jgi:hypothetical protein
MAVEPTAMRPSASSSCSVMIGDAWQHAPVILEAEALHRS